jgi:nitroreductase
VELYEVVRTTSAVRHFTNDPLSDEILYTILDNARFAPSGGNRQGTRIVIIRDPDTRQALVELTIPATKKYVAQRQAGENPWNTIYPSRVSDDEIAAAEVPESFTAPLLQAGVVLVVCVDLRVVAALDKELDRVGIVGGASVYPLVWNILLAARNEGFEIPAERFTCSGANGERRAKVPFDRPDTSTSSSGQPTLSTYKLNCHAIPEKGAATCQKSLPCMKSCYLQV